jgi:2-dehydrotetronate isomerase
MTKLSANLGFLWPERPLTERIAAAGRAGFPAVELHWPYDVPAEDTRRACALAGVQLLGINTLPGEVASGDFGLAAVPGREAAFEQHFQVALDYARAAGGTSIHVLAGVVADGPASRTTLVGNLRGAAAEAERAGVTLLLEAMNGRDRPGYFYSTVERVAEIIDAVGSSRVRMMFDCYHVGVEQGETIARLEAMMPLIGHIQIAAVPSRAEPDEGDLDYAEVFAAIEKLGYLGFVGCEYRPRGDTDAGLKWRAMIRPS